MTDDEIASLMNAAAGEHWGTEMHFRRFAYALLAAERAKRDALLEALKLAKSIIGHPDDAHSQMIDAAIKAVEEKT